MLGVAGHCSKVVNPSVVRRCGNCSRLFDSNEKPLLKGKRDRECGRKIPSEEEKIFCLRNKIFMITLKEKPRELFKVDVWLSEDTLKLGSSK